ncbi:HetZ-related protein [Roseofilum casamattae]|uniref:HetZ-related protein n=1 Tax=Roseofilum casamattae BLCC-M143 TaxID=3022442 RepID=A0ABT7BS05_9CYAN|nr:HetZ-related protein [Roseofilum casamattae]MDJ1181960.1 HetZ-related protein [Roseofilum casamattae BLCC-M143]
MNTQSCITSTTHQSDNGQRLTALNHSATPATEIPESSQSSHGVMDIIALTEYISQQIRNQIRIKCRSVNSVADRMANEVDRICLKSDRIQKSGVIKSWQQTLGNNRVEKCLHYYQLGSYQGRSELHGNLSVMVYRHIAKSGARLGFKARYNLIEDFMQSFYVETLKAFRRENDVAPEYSPRTRLELAEYMAFTEQYAKRRIGLPGGVAQRLIVLRAQNFSRRLPQEMSVDIEMAVESGKGEEAQQYSRDPALHQIREKMVAGAIDPSDSVLRDRVIRELTQYLQEQEQFDCVDYLKLKLQDFSATEIDETLGLTPRQRDYLQQRFKYHVEKFSRLHNWHLVHQWLGADLDQNLGMSPSKWQAFFNALAPEQQQLFQLKQAGIEDAQIATTLRCTPKQLQKRWNKLLEWAWKTRNQSNS